jgi:hypothetical protein
MSSTPNDKPSNVDSFIKNIIDDDYAAANRDLVSSIHQKLKNKIKEVYDTKILNTGDITKPLNKGTDV